MIRREFAVTAEYRYDRRGPVRWVASHVLRYKGFVALFVLGTLGANALAAAAPALTGRAFDAVLSGEAGRGRLAAIALSILGVVAAAAAVDLAARLATEVLGKRVERDAREELYLSLLGKSQTFHNRQRAGDIMARATGDVRLVNGMIVPGADTLFDTLITLAAALAAIAILDPRLLLAPILFTLAFALALRAYLRRLAPVSAALRERFGELNAGLTETVAGIEVVKATAREEAEGRKFDWAARQCRDAFVRNGAVQARYLPPLLLAVATAGAFLHGLWLVSRGQLSVGDLVAYLGLLGLLRAPASLSLWTFAQVRLGVAGAERILATLCEETELDENAAGHAGPLRGEIRFEGVSFGYGSRPVLKDVSFRAAPGQTVAIVGQTGAGKSTLTRLVNRIYDVDDGRVTIDGVDVRDWRLDALRARIATIEQEPFLFSRPIAENIAFGLGPRVDRAAVERAARDAWAHDFIAAFKDGYETVVGERGVTLSAGQRQRLAIGRALLIDPRILILDDATSAVDSATEDRIGAAIGRLQEGRTTLLITHRLAQIRRADHILVLHEGRLLDQGDHEALLARCDLYRRIFAHHDPDPPAGAVVGRGKQG